MTAAGDGQEVDGGGQVLSFMPTETPDCTACGNRRVTWSGRRLVTCWACSPESIGLARLSDALRAIADAEGGPMFMKWPDRWWDDPHWRCVGGHVSTRVLKSEALGRDACLGPDCGRAPIHLTFPEDEDGPLTLAPAARSTEEER